MTASKDTSLPSKTYTLHKDYTLLPDREDENHFAVSITSGPYEGVIFRFNEIKIIEQKDSATFAFSYSIGANVDVIVDKQDFEQHASAILDSLINELPDESVMIE